MLRVIASVFLILLAGPSAAQITGALAPTPKLKGLVIVTSEIVRIGDLVENAGPSANIAVFRSPDLGTTGGVPVARVVEVLAPHKLAALDTGMISEVVVTRLSRPITGKEVEARVARALAGQFGFGEAKNLSITFDRDLRTIHVESNVTEDLQVAHVNVEQRTGRFQIAFELPGSATARRMPLRFRGTVVETLEATVLVRSLNRGEVIKANDLATERRPKAELTSELINAEQATGLAAKRPLRSGSVLRPSDLMKPEVVQRNEPVTITYEMPGIVLTARGKALDAGSVGELVAVLNIQSNRTVHATITGPGRVSVTSHVTAPSTTSAISSEPPTPARPTE